MQANLYLRSSKTIYGAEHYALSLKELLSKHGISLPIQYLTTSRSSILKPLELLFTLALHTFFKTRHSIDIYQFPFHPFFVSGARLDSVIIVFHHADITGGTFLSRLSELYGLLTLKLLHAHTRFVVVSEFWQSYLESRGFTNVHLIRNSISSTLLDYIPSSSYLLPTKCQVFSTSFNDNLSIYLGIARSSKGWSQISRIVRHYFPTADIWLSSSFKTPGFTTEELRIITECNIIVEFSHSISDFYSKLKHVSLSIHNSQFKEGWNRTLVETALISNSITLCSHEGGMIDVANTLPWIIPYNNLDMLEDYLFFLAKSSQFNVQLNACLSLKSVSLPNALSLLSAERFADSWIRQLDPQCTR